MSEQTTPPELHEGVGRISVQGDVDMLTDDELAEIGVTREHGEGYARFLAVFTTATMDPLGASGDDLSSYDY